MTANLASTGEVAMSRAAVFAPSFSSRHVTNVPLSCDRRSALFECWQSGWTADSRHAMQRRVVAMGTSCACSFLPLCTLKLSIMYLLHTAARCAKDEARRAQTGSAADRPEARAPLAESAIPGGSCSFARAPVLVSLREPRPLLSPACTRVPGHGCRSCSSLAALAHPPMHRIAGTRLPLRIKRQPAPVMNSPGVMSLAAPRPPVGERETRRSRVDLSCSSRSRAASRFAFLALALSPSLS